MLTATVLNSSATLNSFYEIGSLEFIPGSQIRLVVKLLQSQTPNLLRFIPEDPAATLHLDMPLTDGTFDQVTMTAFSGDRSMWYADLSEAFTEDLASGNVTFTLDALGDGSVMMKGLIKNALSLTITGGAC
jgi:hypothetical protein